VSKGSGGKDISFSPDQPNLHLTTKEQLMVALKKIFDAERDVEEYELRGEGVSSCARSLSRTQQQTNFFADYGNNGNSNSSNKGDSNNGKEVDWDVAMDVDVNDDNNDATSVDVADDDNDATDIDVDYEDDGATDVSVDDEDDGTTGNDLDDDGDGATGDDLSTMMATA